MAPLYAAAALAGMVVYGSHLRHFKTVCVAVIAWWLATAAIAAVALREPVSVHTIAQFVMAALAGLVVASMVATVFRRWPGDVPSRAIVGGLVAGLACCWVAAASALGLIHASGVGRRHILAVGVMATLGAVATAVGSAALGVAGAWRRSWRSPRVDHGAREARLHAERRVTLLLALRSWRALVWHARGAEAALRRPLPMAAGRSSGR